MNNEYNEDIWDCSDFDSGLYFAEIKPNVGASKVVLRMAPAGTGIIAGGPMRAIFETLGVQDVVTKSVGSANPYNMVRATFEALSQLQSPRLVASRRGIKVSQVVGRKKAVQDEKSTEQKRV